MGDKAGRTVFDFLAYGQLQSSPPKEFLKPLIAELLRAAQHPKENWSYVSNLISEIAAADSTVDELRPCLPILVAHLTPKRGMQFDAGPTAALNCLARCGKAAVPTLIGALRDPHTPAELRPALVGCLAQIGPDEALPVVLSKDLNQARDNPNGVACLVNRIGPKMEHLPVLLQLLDDSGGGAQQAILKLGEAARPEVLKLLDSEDARRRKAGLDLLLAMKPNPLATVGAIVNCLKRERDEIGLMHVLATLGPRAADATSSVLSRLQSRYVRVRSAACITLARITEPGKPAAETVLTALSGATNDGFAEVRAAAADAIGLIGPPCVPSRQAIERLRHDRFATVRHAAERAARSLDNHQPPPAKIWTNYFDPDGPATGSALVANE
jgi:hypothetical protein